MIEVKAYAGLIRNHVELARELGVSIDGLSRQEREPKLLVAAYEQWGHDMGSHINGQFALALYDTEKDQLFCTRDVLGAELFFYYQTADGRLLVGTEIKELFNQPGFVRELNEEMIQFYISFTYLPGEETLFKGVYKLEPGGYLTFDAEGLKLGTYWELSFEPDESKSLEEWADEITNAMEASLHDILDEGETPDSFLSGGVDSSYILAKSTAKKGICAAYENQEASEEDQARETAAYFGRDFEGVTITPEEFLANVDEFLVAYEIPTADVAGLSLYSACKRIKGSSDLVFSGEGADEFFAGYSVYQNSQRYGSGSSVYFGTTYIMNAAEQSRFLKHYYPQRTTLDFMRERAAGGRQYDPVSFMLYSDLRTYFEGSILYNSTKIARGTGLDIRMPYCDLRIFDIARRLPSRFKADGKGGNKLALRAAASRVLPESVAYRKKLGFPVPVRAWLATPAFKSEISRAFKSESAAKFFKQEELDALLNAYLGKKSLRHPVWFYTHKNNLWRYVWTLYTFIRWYELFFVES